MDSKLKRYVDDGFMTEAQAEYIADAITKGETLIASGHRSAGVKNLMAAIMMIASGQHKTAKVSTPSDAEADAVYLIVPKFDEETYQETLQACFNQKGKALVAMKDPEHPYSVMKFMTVASKTHPDPDKVVNLIECRKINGVPKVIKFSRMSYNERGKVVREDREAMEGANADEA